MKWLLPWVAALVACAAEHPPAPVPEVVVATRGSTNRASLLSMQAYVQPADYSAPALFEARLRSLFDEAKARSILDERTVVVLPEYVGTWLVALDEGAGVSDARTLQDGMTALAVAHLPRFMWSSWHAPAADGDAFAAFTVKAARMAGVYDDVMSRLAHDYGVTVVAGSIILPAARIEGGRLAVTPGEALQNVSVVYDAAGHAVAISKKVFLTAEEQPFLAPGRLDDIAVVDTPAGRLGVLVCADAWFPESYAQLARGHAELLAVPTFHDGAGFWDKPWRGYSGHAAAADVDAADVGTITEAQAWDKYALAGRARSAGIKAAVSSPLRGSLWDLGDDGQAFLVDEDGFARMNNVDGPALFALHLP